MMRRSVLLAFVLAATPAIAKPKKSAPKSSVPTTATVKAFCETFEEAEQKAGCNIKEDKVNRARQQCIELVNSGLSQKRIHYDAAAAHNCLEARTAYAKDPKHSHAHHEAVRSTCAGVTTGLMGEGDSCESTLDCKAPFACIGKKGGPPGKCAKRLEEGDACDDEMLGSSQFYATVAALRPTCAQGMHCSLGGPELKCTKDVAMGDECTGKDPGECGVGGKCVKGKCVDEGGEVCSEK